MSASNFHKFAIKKKKRFSFELSRFYRNDLFCLVWETNKAKAIKISVCVCVCVYKHSHIDIVCI